MASLTLALSPYREIIKRNKALSISAELQRVLAEGGFTSYALQLSPGPLKCRAHSRGNSNWLWGSYEQDLREAVRSLDLGSCVLLGHSQGGVLVQSVLRDPEFVKEIGVAGVALCGTVPLSSMAPAASMLWRGEIKPQHRNIITELGLLGNWYYATFGRLWSENVIQRIFFLPSTQHTTVCSGGLREYMARLLAAPSDGWPTYQHFWGRTPSFAHLADIDVFLVSAERDIIYPPTLLPLFQHYFPQLEHHMAREQAHCFADPGWEQELAKPLAEWLQRRELRTKAH